jgi:hypothetical protein
VVLELFLKAEGATTVAELDRVVERIMEFTR